METSHTDIKSRHWSQKYLPSALRPYAILARLDRPIGIWLLLLPALWGIAIAGYKHTDTLQTVFLFSIGAVIMRAAGCVINDIWDKNLDKRVIRTASRPIARGDISIKQGLLFLLFLMTTGLAILLQFNPLTVLIGIVTLPLIILYPAMKRITYWPQAFLGITFNAGALMGYTAMTGHFSPICLYLYIGGIFWTLAYDTIYAHQDIEDDVLAGIKSTALKFRKHSKKWVGSFFILSFIFFIVALGKAFYVLLPAALHAVWQMKTWQENQPQSALDVFKSNRDFGFLILAGIVLSSILL